MIATREGCVLFWRRLVVHRAVNNYSVIPSLLIFFALPSAAILVSALKGYFDCF